MNPAEQMSMNQYGDVRALFGDAFRESDIKSTSDFDVLPPCKPQCLIERAQFKQNKKANGHYLEITLQVIDGPHKNRKLWDRINIDNPDQTCVKIGMGQLKKLLKATEINDFEDTSQLLNKVVIAHVAVQKNDVYGDQNVIRGYSDVVTPTAPVAVPQAAGPAPATQAGPAEPGNTLEKPAPEQAPWMRDKGPFQSS